VLSHPIEEDEMSVTEPNIAPITLGPDQGEAVWFFGGLTWIKAGGDATGGRVAVTENLAPRGAGSPLHVHRREDEWFWILEGEVTYWVGGEVFEASAGSFVYGPRGIPHTFAVSSERARYLLVTEPGDFVEFVRMLAEPAPRLEIPPPASEPPDIEALSRVAERFGLEILGPPGIPG
jgi:quercetin dioxygenase-like cupin family protein